jgi:hypothetical protein
MATGSLSEAELYLVYCLGRSLIAIEGYGGVQRLT